MGVLKLWDGVDWREVAEGLLGSKALHVRDEKAQNTAGGTFTSGAWQTRDLNAVKLNEIVGASVAGNQITLPAGEYEVLASVPAAQVGMHQARLYNVTGAVELLLGTQEYTSPGTGLMSRSNIRGKFTLAAETVVRIEHRCITTKATDGYGYPGNVSTEVYTEVVIRKGSEQFAQTPPVIPLLHVRDEKANATNGGALNAGWQTRVLNTVKTNEITGASLAANEITLPAGTYEIDATAPAFRVDGTISRLYNVTAGAVLLQGPNGFSSSTGTYSVIQTSVKGKFTLATTSVIRLEQYATTTRGTDGAGPSLAVGLTEVYAEVMLRKVA